MTVSPASLGGLGDGDCYDNAPVESFFATLKKELVAGEVFYTREQARLELWIRSLSPSYRGDQ